MRMKSELAICVVGLGYVGLPTAVAFYNSGFKEDWLRGDFAARFPHQGRVPAGPALLEGYGL